MRIFQSILLWMDPVRRSGPESMAVDEWLLETAVAPVLRVYEWAGEWASVGYFGKIVDARELLPHVKWVRRWTGGGVVDHRADWTYTLVVPREQPLARLRGAESYRRIHAALAESLAAEGVDVQLSGGAEETGAALCFENPVGHDLIGSDARKMAGAGQRRSRQGLLHQGSVSVVCGEASQRRAEDFAGRIAMAWEVFSGVPDPLDLARRAAARYAREEWTARR